MSGSYDMLQKEALDYGFPTQYLHEVLLLNLSKLLHLDYYTIYNLTISISLGIIFKLILLISAKLEISPNNKKVEVFSGLFFVLYPALHTLYTTQNFIWVICILLLLTGITALFHEKRIVRIAGVICIGYSFQMASLPFVFLPIYWWYSWKYQRKRFISYFVWSSILSAVALILFREVLFPPRNLYLHYNEIVFSKHFFKAVLINLGNYSLFIFLFMLIVFGINGKFHLIHNLFSVKHFRSPDIIFTLLLFAGCCFPYIMANKSPKPFDLFDWSWRHAIVLIIPFSILSLKLHSEKHVSNCKKIDLIQKFTAGLAFLALICATLLSNYGHVQTMLYDKYVVSLLSDKKDLWAKSEILCFSSSVKRMNVPRFYELNELAWESTGQTKWQFYPDSRCNSQDIPSGSLRNSPQLTGMTQSQWKGVYMGGTGNSKWMAIHITGNLDFIKVITGIFRNDHNPLKIEFSELENGVFKGSDEEIEFASSPSGVPRID